MIQIQRGVSMSYHEQAEKINAQLKEGVAIDNEGNVDKEKIINAFIWAGQGAKFRCRNNSAYESFMRLVLKDIAEVKYVPFKNDGSERDFDILRVVKNL